MGLLSKVIAAAKGDEDIGDVLLQELGTAIDKGLDAVVDFASPDTGAKVVITDDKGGKTEIEDDSPAVVKSSIEDILQKALGKEVDMNPAPKKPDTSVKGPDGKPWAGPMYDPKIGQWIDPTTGNVTSAPAGSSVNNGAFVADNQGYLPSSDDAFSNDVAALMRIRTAFGQDLEAAGDIVQAFIHLYNRSGGNPTWVDGLVARAERVRGY